MSLKLSFKALVPLIPGICSFRSAGAISSFVIPSSCSRHHTLCIPQHEQQNDHGLSCLGGGMLKINHEAMHTSVDSSCCRSECTAEQYVTGSADCMQCTPCTAGLFCRAMRSFLTGLRSEIESTAQPEMGSSGCAGQIEILWGSRKVLTWNLPPLTSLKERIAAPSSAKV